MFVFCIVFRNVTYNIDLTINRKLFLSYRFLFDHCWFVYE